MKTLIIVAHPNIAESVINKRWGQELYRYPEAYTVHTLSLVYPQNIIDVQREQQLIETHQSLVFQFPIFWFSSPPILKKWFDEVLTRGFAYGKNGGDKLKNRKVALAVSTGITKKDYGHEGRYHYTLEQLLSPIEASLRYYCHADYRSFFAFYGAESTPGLDYRSAEEEIEKSAKDYLNFLGSLK